MSERDDDLMGQEVAEWIRQHPEVWDVSDEARLTDDRIERIVDSVVAETRSAGVRRRGSRRRRLVIGGTCALAAVAGGAVGVAALIRSDQPTNPEAGTLCLARPQLETDAIVIPAGEDPITGCRRLWEAGRFKNTDVVGIPTLTACIGPTGGAFWVFPGEESVCADLGLVIADPVLSPENIQIVALQDALATEVNLREPCLSGPQATEAAQRLVADSGLADWQVVVDPDAEFAPCVKAGLDGATRTVTIHSF